MCFVEVVKLLPQERCPAVEMGSSTESSTPHVSGCGAGRVAQATRGPSEPSGSAAPGKGRGLFSHYGLETRWRWAALKPGLTFVL